MPDPFHSLIRFSSPSLLPYPFLCPLAPRKGSWLADKVKRLIRPRREGALHGGPRLGADGAGSTESLGGPLETELPEGREADGTGGSEGLVTRMSLSHVSHLWHLLYCLACTCASLPPACSCLDAVGSLLQEYRTPAWAPPFCLYCHLPISTQRLVTPKTSEQQGTLGKKDYLSLMVVQKETKDQRGWGALPKAPQ